MSLWSGHCLEEQNSMAMVHYHGARLEEPCSPGALHLTALWKFCYHEAAKSSHHLERWQMTEWWWGWWLRNSKKEKQSQRKRLTWGSQLYEHQVIEWKHLECDSSPQLPSDWNLRRDPECFNWTSQLWDL